MGSAVLVSPRWTPMSLQMPLNLGRQTVTMELKILAFAGVGLFIWQSRWLVSELEAMYPRKHVASREGPRADSLS